jgi:23S rRNA pseudouridine2605 synthase
MSKTNGFQKFITRKKGSVIKEEARQEKRRIKKEKAEAIERRRNRPPVIPRDGAPDGDRRGNGPAPSGRPAILKRTPVEEKMPLNKYIAHCGVCARRDAATLVRDGKVKVNGTPVLEPGYKMADGDSVTVNGKKIHPEKNLVYILLNKPKDCITTAADTHGRKTVLDLVRSATPERVYPVGRLDRNTTGVLLLTNDGELAQKLSHPSFEVRKTYEARLDKPLAKTDFDKILAGVTLEDGNVTVDALAHPDPKDRSIVGIEIHSGRNRIVRRLFEALGYDVRNLDRVVFANLTKKNVDRGKWRFLQEKEVRLLKYLNRSFLRRTRSEPTP